MAAMLVFLRLILWKEDRVHDQSRGLAGSACSTPSEAYVLIVCVQ